MPKQYKTRSLLLLVSCAFALSAYAEDNLTIINHTKRDSTSIINKGPCSTILGKDGVTKAGETNVIKRRKIVLACGVRPHNCQADVYMTNNCTGPSIGSVTFDIDTGIIGQPVILDPNYKISAPNSFTFLLEGGPENTK